VTLLELSGIKHAIATSKTRRKEKEPIFPLLIQQPMRNGYYLLM
jgi:hypothetical protein